MGRSERAGAGRPTRVLFVCTHNSARSQIAEALLRRRGGDRFEVASAGSEPGQRVHPLALRIIEEIGGDATRHRPKGLDEARARSWDLVVTVCDDARDACPALPAGTTSVHWGLPDPSRVTGSDEQRWRAFRATLSSLSERIDGLVAQNS
jgi:arsenate reductase